MTDDQWSDYLSSLAPNGVLAEAPRVSLTSGLTFSIPDGLIGRVKGIHYRNVGVQTKTGTANGNTNPRIDRLVLRYDRSAKTITPTIIQGTPAASPQAPALSAGPNLWDEKICQARCPGSGSAQNYSQLVHEFTAFSSARGRHSWVGDAIVNSSGVTFNLTANGAGDGIATLSGAQQILLNRPGKWSIMFEARSDGVDDGLSTISMDWVGGPTGDDDQDARPRYTGFAGAGFLHQRITMTGLVSVAQALTPIVFRARWQSLGPTLQYFCRVDAHYLGG